MRQRTKPVILGTRRNAIGAAAVDPYFTNVGLLLHCDAAGGTTTFVDSSLSAKTISRAGNAVHASRIATEFGGSCVYLDGTGDALIAPSSSDWDMGTGNFTVEMFVNLDVVTSGWLVVRRDTTSPFSPFGLLLQSVGSLRLVVANNAGSAYTIDVTTAGQVLFPGQWHHVVLGRNGNQWGAYVDGVAVLAPVDAVDMYVLNESLVFGAGAADGSAPNLQGYIDEIRVTKGVWRYVNETSTFTVPTAAFPNR